MNHGTPERHLFVIFGGTGDLAHRKLLPALAGLAGRGLLPSGSAVLAAGRRPMADDAFRASVREALAEAGLRDAGVEEWCDTRLFYQSLGGGGAEGYRALEERIREVEGALDLPGNRVFYLALPPEAFPPTVEGLGEAGLQRAPGWSRLVVEKPFGRDLESARALNGLVHRYFDETQVYRIDHYLGKETVQNLLVFRFANPIFETLWNRDRIESVHLSVAEDLGVEQRADYYDRSGALRDIVQNHLTQLLTLVAMEPPAAVDAEGIRAEKLKVLKSVEPIHPERAVFGQYTAGRIGEREVRGYREEPGVDPGSATPTFVSLPLGIANWRWQGVPFVLTTGKRLPRRLSQVVVRFRRAPVRMFEGFHDCRLQSNELVLTLQPDEGFSLGFDVKRPGEGFLLDPQHLRFEYADTFGRLHDAYETLLLDVVSGDPTLFVHAEEVEWAWRLYQPLLEHPPRLDLYAAGTWGPGSGTQHFGTVLDPRAR